MKLVNPSAPSGEGEMGALIRSFDWSQTSLGPLASWPYSLQSAVDLMLPSRAQIVLFWGPDFIALYNDAYAPTIGAKHPDALGRPAREHWGELWSDLEPLLRRVHAGETVFAKDRPFVIARHGYLEEVFFDISYSPIREPGGGVAGVLCIVNETTDRVVSQRRLLDSQEQLQAIFAQTASGIAQIDTGGRFTLVNARFCQIVGYDSTELLEMRVDDIVHPDDLSSAHEELRRVVTTDTSLAADIRLVRKDGSRVWVSNSVSPIADAAGHVRQVVAMVMDITERKRAEAMEKRMAAIIASSEDAILSTDLDMRITSWNGGAERLYLYSPQEAIGRSVTMLVPEDRPDEEAVIISRIRDGHRVEPHETRRRRKDGTLIDVLLTVSPVRDEHGRVVGASKIAHDISARKNAERLQLAVIDEMKHRIKNVLAMVQAIARQTLTDASDKKARDAFDARLRSIASAYDLLTAQSWRSADVAAVVAGALAPFAHNQISAAGPSIPLDARAVVALSMALHELATNAVKYGALSVEEGKVAIAWGADAERRLWLRWRESGGPPVAAPTRRGFGARLIQDILAAELDGEVALNFEAAGLVCEVSALSHRGD